MAMAKLRFVGLGDTGAEVRNVYLSEKGDYYVLPLNLGQSLQEIDATKWQHCCFTTQTTLLYLQEGKKWALENGRPTLWAGDGARVVLAAMQQHGVLDDSPEERGKMFRVLEKEITRFGGLSPLAPPIEFRQGGLKFVWHKGSQTVEVSDDD